MRACGSARRPPAPTRAWDELHEDGGKRGRAPARSCRGQLSFERVLSTSRFCRCSGASRSQPCSHSPMGQIPCCRGKVTRGLGASPEATAAGASWQGCSQAVLPGSPPRRGRGLRGLPEPRNRCPRWRNRPRCHHRAALQPGKPDGLGKSSPTSPKLWESAEAVGRWGRWLSTGCSGTGSAAAGLQLSGGETGSGFPARGASRENPPLSYFWAPASIPTEFGSRCRDAEAIPPPTGAQHPPCPPAQPRGAAPGSPRSRRHR